MRKQEPWDLRAHVNTILGSWLTQDEKCAAIFELMDQGLQTRCTDGDCARRRRHPLVALHAWRHAPNPPLDRGLLGWRCFTCGQYTWRRIHKKWEEVAK